jgi:hypothetical protein
VQKLDTTAAIMKSGVTCPDCGAPHEPDSGNFCEICGYNFATGAHGEVPIYSLETPPAVQVVETKEAIKNQQIATSQWELVVTIDPSLAYPESPPPPTDQPPLIFPLEKAANLIGRNSQAKGTHPEIALDFDTAISHRHALLTRQADGSFTLRDIGSSNGTYIEEEELKPMLDVPLQDGDEFTLGHWTRIKIRNIQGDR